MRCLGFNHQPSWQTSSVADPPELARARKQRENIFRSFGHVFAAAAVVSSRPTTKAESLSHLEMRDETRRGREYWSSGEINRSDQCSFRGIELDQDSSNSQNESRLLVFVLFRAASLGRQESSRLETTLSEIRESVSLACHMARIAFRRATHTHTQTRKHRKECRRGATSPTAIPSHSALRSTLERDLLRCVIILASDLHAPSSTNSPLPRSSLARSLSLSLGRVLGLESGQSANRATSNRHHFFALLATAAALGNSAYIICVIN